MTGRTRRGRSPGAALRGGTALLTLIILVVGLPIALYRLGGDPLPHHIPSWHHIGTLLLHRDNGTVFLGAVRDLSWIAWAAFTAAVAVEAQAAVRGRRAPRLRLLGIQNAASWLVAASALAFSSSSAAVLASTPNAPVAAVSSIWPGPPPARPAPPLARPAGLPAQAGADAKAAQPLAPQVMSMGFYQMVTVRGGDCLWTIAQRYLGQGDLYHEIVRLNLGHAMGDGQTFTDPAVVWPGWVLQLPASPDQVPTAATGPAAPVPHGHGASQHGGHDTGDPRFRHPHPAALPTGPGPDTAGPAGLPGTGAEPPARHATPDHAAGGAPHAAQPGQIPPLAIFGAGVLAGGATVALARMRRRQRQARRFGRRIPLPVSAPVIAAEQRLRAATLPYPGPDPVDEQLFYTDAADDPDAYVYADPEPEPEAFGYDEPEPEALPQFGSEAAPEALLQPATALRAALSQLGSGLAAAGQPIPDIAAVQVRRSGMELLLASPSSEPPPAPFAVAGGRQGMAWRLELPWHAPARTFPSTQPRRGAETGDLLPGLLTAGIAEDGGYLLIDLEYLGVTTVDGPADLADLVLSTAAAELTTSQLAGWYDLILAGFPELDAVDGRATSCAGLAEALDLVASKAVTLRRRLGDADRSDVRQRRLEDPGDEDWALTLLVSRTAPTTAQMAMLLDLASDPGGIAALVPGGTEVLEGHPAPASFRLDADPARPGGIVGHVSPLHADVWPQPLARDDYEALASLFATAADLRDVGADQPPYDGSSWPPAPELIGLQEPPAADLAELEEPPATHPEPGTRGSTEDPSVLDQSAGLRIGVMGTFTVNGAPAALQPAQSQLILALALNGQDGLSNAQLCYLLGADPDHPKPSDSLRQLIVRTRRQLGRAPDGREWIEHLGAGQYALHPHAKFDWADFEELSERGLQDHDPAWLRDALALIRGKPFTGCYHWWLDLAFTETVRAQIVDAAELLAELELAAGDPSASARAARAGLSGDAAAEQLWRAVMRAEHAAGNLAGVREAWRRCLDTMTDIAADGEPHPETAALYQQLIGGGRPQSAWARSYP
jgi:DNA-binding SARP family transcriptional activator